MSEARLEPIFDWNRRGGGPAGARRRVGFDDETLRDGLQCPSVRIPAIEEKLALLHLMAAVGIGAADVGIPGAGPRAAADAERLCREVVSARLPLAPNCAARTVEADIRPVLDIVQRTGIPVEIAMFVGSSRIRREVEGWSLDDVLRRTSACVRLATANGAPVTFVTEDTTRSHPKDLALLYLEAVRAGASRVCIADTAGHATPLTVVRIVRFVRNLLAGQGVVGIDWHGHNDRGLAVANALTAAWAGADRLHGTALGLGERVGNPPMEQLLVNAWIEDWAAPDLGRVGEYVALAARVLGVDVPAGAPMVGRDAFRTATGVHAAAIRKARAAGNDELVDLIYSSVPAARLGRQQVIEVGPMSGASNVRCWLAAHGYAEEPGVVARVLAAAKQAERSLSDEELHGLARPADAG